MGVAEPFRSGVGGTINLNSPWFVQKKNYLPNPPRPSHPCLRFFKASTRAQGKRASRTSAGPAEKAQPEDQ